MRVLLVQPPLDPSTSKITALGMAEPLGLEYVAAGLRGHDVRILDLRVEGSLPQVMQEFTPHVVGCTSVTVTLHQALELLQQAKALDPGCTTVLGGVHATLRPGDCAADGVDAIVRGDGEWTMAQLVQCLERGTSLAGVRGLVHRDGDRWHDTGPRPLPPLDDYPHPARELTELNRAHYSRVGLGQTVFAVSSRGCSRRCSFCSVWRTHGGKYRTRSAEHLVAELAGRAERYVDLVDDDSFGSPARMDRLCSLAREQLPGRQYKALVRADVVVRHPDLFRRWAELGLRYAIIGLESFRDDELRDINKRADAAQNRQALAILDALGIGVIGYLMVRPDYTLEDFERLGDAVEQLGVAQPVFTTLTPLPGTVLFDRVRSQLTTHRWSDLDGFRAVLPTVLPRPVFYQQLAQLYRRAYGTVTGAGELPWHEQLARWIETIQPR